MIKIYLLTLLSFLPAVSMGQSNAAIDQETAPVFLLKAPGTVTGIQSAPPVMSPGNAPRFKASARAKPLRYKSPVPDNRVDSFKFPQYGQTFSRNNPWGDREQKRRLPPVLPPANPFAENPWDLSGKLPAQSNQGFQPEAPAAPGYYSIGNHGFDAYGSPQALYPDYPDAIYRDSNPASTPFGDGMIPWAGDKGFDFPFNPFSMF